MPPHRPSPTQLSPPPSNRPPPASRSWSRGRTRLLAALGKEGADEDNIKRDIQTLIFEYDAFLRTYPTFAPGYVTYGLLLGKVGMRRESVGDPAQGQPARSRTFPIVKNQLGNYLAEEGEPIEAANYFIAAIRLAPEEPLYHYQLGTLLTEARDDFLKSGQWTRAQLDQHHAGGVQARRRAGAEELRVRLPLRRVVLRPRRARLGRGAQGLGRAGGPVLDPGLEKETIRLQAANILIKQKKFDHARLLLNTVTTEKLQAQKQKLVDQLPADPVKPAAPRARE